MLFFSLSKKKKKKSLNKADNFKMGQAEQKAVYKIKISRGGMSLQTLLSMNNINIVHRLYNIILREKTSALTSSIQIHHLAAQNSLSSLS